MPRPSSDPARPTARERILDAFWQLFRSIEFKQITVERVCRRAHVTRSTFYRYFTNLRDVLDQIEDEAIPFYVPGTIVEAYLNGDTMDDAWDYIMTHEKQLEQVLVLLSSQGDPSFNRILKDAMIDSFAEVTKVELTDLDQENRLRLEFVVAGYIALMAFYANSPLTVSPAETMKLANPVVREYLGPFLNETNFIP